MRSVGAGQRGWGVGQRDNPREEALRACASASAFLCKKNTGSSGAARKEVLSRPSTLDP